MRGFPRPVSLPANVSRALAEATRVTGVEYPPPMAGLVGQTCALLCVAALLLGGSSCGTGGAATPCPGGGSCVPCNEDAECIFGESCLVGLCTANPRPGNGAPPGDRDAGLRVPDDGSVGPDIGDAGIRRDAGPLRDAGGRPDGGMPRDGGDSLDGGLRHDGGDAAGDAGELGDGGGVDGGLADGGGCAERLPVLAMTSEAPTGTSAIATPGLIAEWRFDRDLQETLMGFPLEEPVSFVPGRIGAAAVLGETPITVSASPDAALQPDAFTLTFWLQLDAESEGSVLCSSALALSGGGFSLDVVGDELLLVIKRPLEEPLPLVLAPLPRSQWVHVAVHYAAGESAATIDGVPYPAHTGLPPLSYASLVPLPRPMVLGGACASTGALHAQLDELAFFARSLTPMERQERLQAGFAGYAPRDLAEIPAALHGVAVSATGVQGAAFGFEEEDAALVIPMGDTPLPTEGFSWSLWFSLAEPFSTLSASSHTLVGRYLAPDVNFHLALVGADYPRMQSPRGSVVAKIETSPMGAAYLHSTPVNLAPGDWHHLVFVSSPEIGLDQHRLYLDGQPLEAELSGIFQPSVANILGDLYIGSAVIDSVVTVDAPSVRLPFRGALDDISLFAEPLSAEEVAVLFQRGTLCRPPG